MVTPLDLSALTLNAKEQPDFMKFVFERVFTEGEIAENHTMWSGVKMKEQIVFASTNILSGIKDPLTTRPNSGGKPVFTEKFWEPENVGDTMTISTQELNSLFKAYADKINSYAEKFDMTGSDVEKFLLQIFTDSAKKCVNRLIWHGDKAIAVSGAAVSGLKADGSVKYFDSVNGIWKKTYAEVGAGKLPRFTITKNAAATFALQELAAGEAITIFEGIWKKADVRLKADPNAKLMVTNTIWENYRQYLQDKGTPYDVKLTTDGFRELAWNGIAVRNMEMLWDLPITTYFEQLNTGLAFDKPHRALFTVKDNIPVATLNDGDFQEMKAKYEDYERFAWLAYGFTLDTQVLEGYMAVAAY